MISVAYAYRESISGSYCKIDPQRKNRVQQHDNVIFNTYINIDLVHNRSRNSAAAVRNAFLKLARIKIIQTGTIWRNDNVCIRAAGQLSSGPAALCITAHLSHVTASSVDRVYASGQYARGSRRNVIDGRSFVTSSKSTCNGGRSGRRPSWWPTVASRTSTYRIIITKQTEKVTRNFHFGVNI